MKRFFKRQLFGLLRISVIVLVIFSCTRLRPKNIHKEADLYTKSFIADMKLENSKLDGYLIGFSNNFVGNIIGVCFIGFRTVMMKRDWWDNASRIQRKALVYHELGHCVCKEFHSNKKNNFEDTCPLSVMNREMPSEYCLNKWWHDYVVDLRSRCN